MLPNLSKLFVVQCDACGHNIGAVLIQDGHVVAYESHLLLGLEMTLQVYEKELLVVIHALSTWKHYLLGAELSLQCTPIIKHCDIFCLRLSYLRSI